ncbi:hypothetical protein HPB51_026057 [Rhipicephalus microplus]|uniref:Uncharacterized protein n=1 Tax=Rhipicephalus microplus TaxID=6941 RepID=A0A9J6EE26_RHIMP|nr:hypothetical protein HPB51_026057 [Rhipicephalus microplus]
MKRSGSESTPPRPSKLAGILKPRPGLFEPPKAHPNKTIRFNTESQHVETPPSEQETAVSVAESLDNSDASASSESSSSNSQETGDEAQQATTQPRHHGAADRVLALPSWFTENVKRCITTFTTRAGPAGGDETSSDGDAGGRRPRRRRAATERYLPQSRDDMRWRVALSRYALLTLLTVAALLLVIAAVHVVRGDARSRAVEQQGDAGTLEDDERPRRRALKTSAREDTAGQGYENNVEESDASLTTTDEPPGTYEQATSAGADSQVDGQRSSTPEQRTAHSARD